MSKIEFSTRREAAALYLSAKTNAQREAIIEVVRDRAKTGRKSWANMVAAHERDDREAIRGYTLFGDEKRAFYAARRSAPKPKASPAPKAKAASPKAKGVANKRKGRVAAPSEQELDLTALAASLTPNQRKLMAAFFAQLAG